MGPPLLLLCITVVLRFPDSRYWVNIDIRISKLPDIEYPDIEIQLGMIGYPYKKCPNIEFDSIFVVRIGESQFNLLRKSGNRGTNLLIKFFNLITHNINFSPYLSRRGGRGSIIFEHTWKEFTVRWRIKLYYIYIYICRWHLRKPSISGNAWNFRNCLGNIGNNYFIRCQFHLMAYFVCSIIVYILFELYLSSDGLSLGVLIIT